MNNENNETIVDSENNEPTEETVETPKEEVKVEKPKRTPQEELVYFEGRAKRLRKDLGLESESTKEPETKPVQKSDGLDYGQKAFLVASGIKGDEIPLAQEIMKRTGLELDALINDDYFQSKLKTFREEKATDVATPKSKRTPQTVVDSVDYHLSKETPLEKIDDMQTRRDVLNARIKQEENKSKFTSTPIVTG